jgi:glutamate formiminotransferase
MLLDAASIGHDDRPSSARPPCPAACQVYVSEGRDAGRLAALRHVAEAAAPGALLANTFIDSPYHRTSFTLLSRSAGGLAAAATALARAALAAIDLRAHEASHPRLGAVDHISCHPLMPATAEGMAAAAQAARAIGEQLGAGPAALPVYAYGAAHPERAALDSVRRHLGYFAGSKSGRWQGALREAAPGAAPPPSFGPAAPAPRSGVCCVGAVPWLVNFNVLLGTEDEAAAKIVARAVSQRAGGLRGVQAMALRHAEGVEVACNLLDPAAVPPAAVEEAVRGAAQAAGLRVLRSYTIGKTVGELLLLAEALPHPPGAPGASTC